MRKGRFSGEQIIGVLKERQGRDGGGRVLPQARDQRRNVLHVAPKYSGLEVSGTNRLKAPEEENRKLKELLAEQMLDAATLREILGKHFWRPAQRGTPPGRRSRRRTTRKGGPAD